MGFAQTEQERLKYAWELCVLYRHSESRLAHRALVLQITMTVTTFLTTLCAVLISASVGGEVESVGCEAENADLGGGILDGYITLPSVVVTTLRLSCSVVPMLSAFFLALAHHFEYTKRRAITAMAAERVCGEIYLYRARVGNYQQRTKNAKLTALMNSPPRVGAQDRTGAIFAAEAEIAESASRSRLTNAQSSREAFREKLHQVQMELMSSEVKMASLHKPPIDVAKTILRDHLYPFGEDTHARITYHPGENVQVQRTAGEGVRWENAKVVESPKADGDVRVVFPKRPPQEEESEEESQREEQSLPRAQIKPKGGSKHEERYHHHNRLEAGELLLAEGLSDFSLLGTTMDDDMADDGIGLISANDYLRFRLLPAISRLHESVPNHERVHNLSKAAILFATMIASVSGILGLHIWIPAVGSVVAAVES
eukprot:COSAG01_NODE_10918_length_2051_cov_1.422643_1_plen_427_part_10